MDPATSCDLTAILQAAGLRATGHRLSIGALVLCGPSRHFSAEQVWKEAQEQGLRISLATVYNTLNGFREAGLLRRVDLPTAAGIFDSNTAPHHHLIAEDGATILDLPAAAVRVEIDPAAIPEGLRLHGVHVVAHARAG